MLSYNYTYTTSITNSPCTCTLNSIPYSDTYVHTVMHRVIPMTPAQSGHARIYAYMPTHVPILLRAA